MFGHRAKALLLIHVHDARENRKLSCYRVHLIKRKKNQQRPEKEGEKIRGLEKETKRGLREGGEGAVGGKELNSFLPGG